MLAANYDYRKVEKVVGEPFERLVLDGRDGKAESRKEKI
jgi:hypothetical protein